MGPSSLDQERRTRRQRDLAEIRDVAARASTPAALPPVRVAEELRRARRVPVDDHRPAGRRVLRRRSRASRRRAAVARPSSPSLRGRTDATRQRGWQAAAVRIIVTPAAAARSAAPTTPPASRRTRRRSSTGAARTVAHGFPSARQLVERDDERAEERDVRRGAIGELLPAASHASSGSTKTAATIRYAVTVARAVLAMNDEHVSPTRQQNSTASSTTGTMRGEVEEVAGLTAHSAPYAGSSASTGSTAGMQRRAGACRRRSRRRRAA